MGYSSFVNSKKDKEYLITIKTEYNILEKKYISAREELNKWEERITLAEKKEKPGLKKEAEGQAEQIRSKIKYLTDQLTGLKADVEQAIITIRKSPQQLSIDPEKLLAEMEGLIGNGVAMDLEKDLNEINVDNELERLKKEMKK